MWIEVSERHAALLMSLGRVLLKGRTHKYIRRVPKPGGGYRYYYKTSGVTRSVKDDLTEGAKFRLTHEGQEGHFEVVGRSGDTVTLRHDESGGTMRVSAADLADLLQREHADVVQAQRERTAKRLAAAKKHGTAKQIARLEAEAKRFGVETLSGDQKAELARIAVNERKRSEQRGADDAPRRFDYEETRARQKSRTFSVEDAKHRAASLGTAIGKNGAIRQRWIDNMKDEARRSMKRAEQDGAPSDVIDRYKRLLDAVYDADTHNYNGGRGIDSFRKRSVDAVGFIDELHSIVREKHAEFDEANEQRLAGEAASVEMPELPPFSVTPDVKSASVAQKRAAQFAMSTKDAEARQTPQLAGVHYGDGYAMATNGHMLSRIPADVPQALEGAVQGKQGKIEPGRNDRGIPKFESMVPRKFEASATIDASQLKSALAELGPKKGDGVKFKAVGGVLFAHLDSDDGSDKRVPVGRYDGPKFDPVTLNPQYVTKALSRANGAVQLNLSKPMAPVLLNREDGEQHIIMPMWSR